jgi:hypothetical protein
VATYKLIQDIEAEDKILGPLTLRQFIFALIAVFLFYICFILVTKHVVFLLIIFLPPALFFGFFALPFGRDQPTEIWALAKLRYWFKPRRRVWNQSGVKELVTITVPKKVERVLTNGLSQTEVKSRLQALAQTIDSRGWATKNIDSDTYGQLAVADASSDRLIDINSLPMEVSENELVASDDMLDEVSNPIARQFDTMINQSSQNHRQQLIDQLNDIRATEATKQPNPAAPDNWFVSQTQIPSAPSSPIVTGIAPPEVSSGNREEEAALSDSLAARANSRHVQFNNLRTVQPLVSQTATVSSAYPLDATGTATDDNQTVADDQASAVTPPSDPAILSLAKNDDLNVATLARQARKNRGDEDQLQNEVVVSLH